MATKRSTKPAPKKAAKKATKKPAPKKPAKKPAPKKPAKKSAPKKPAKKPAPKKKTLRKSAGTKASFGTSQAEPPSERPPIETFDTNEEPRGRAQLTGNHTHDEIDDEAEADTDTTDVQTGLFVRRDEGQAT